MSTRSHQSSSNHEQAFGETAQVSLEEIQEYQNWYFQATGQHLDDQTALQEILREQSATAYRHQTVATGRRVGQQAARHERARKMRKKAGSLGPLGNLVFGSAFRDIEHYTKRPPKKQGWNAVEEGNFLSNIALGGWGTVANTTAVIASGIVTNSGSSKANRHGNEKGVSKLTSYR